MYELKQMPNNYKSSKSITQTVFKPLLYLDKNLHNHAKKREAKK